MNRHFRWVQLWCLGLVCTVAANAAPKSGSSDSSAWNGWFEGGYSNGWTGGGAVGTGGNNFFVDNLVMGKTFDVTDKTKVVVDNVFSASSATANAHAAAAVGAGGNSYGMLSKNYYSGTYGLFSGTAAANNFALQNRALYLQHNCGDHFNFRIGHFRTGFGMESAWERYDMHSYFYSRALGVAAGYGWLYGMGAQFNLVDLAGNWSFSLVDNRAGANLAANASNNAAGFPSLVVAWNVPIRAGDLTITPAFSGVFGRFGRGMGDLGFTGGLTLKGGMFWIATEAMLANRNPTGAPGTATTDLSIWAEPGLDFGVAKVSAKVDWMHTSTAATPNTGWGIGGAISHEWADKYRVKLTYNHGDLTANVGGHTNDIRLLFGTKW